MIQIFCTTHGWGKSHCNAPASQNITEQYIPHMIDISNSAYLTHLRPRGHWDRHEHQIVADNGELFRSQVTFCAIVIPFCLLICVFTVKENTTLRTLCVHLSYATCFGRIGYQLVE